MADLVMQHDVGAYGSLRVLAGIATLVAGGAGNNAAVTGVTFDRAGFGNGSVANAAEIGLIYTAEVSKGNTLSASYVINTSDDSVTWAPFVPNTTAVLATGTTAAGAVSGQLNFPVDFTGAGRFIQLVYTPTLSAAETDTASVGAVGFFAGFDRLPAPL